MLEIFVDEVPVGFDYGLKWALFLGSWLCYCSSLYCIN